MDSCKYVGTSELSQLPLCSKKVLKFTKISEMTVWAMFFL